MSESLVVPRGPRLGHPTAGPDLACALRGLREQGLAAKARRLYRPHPGPQTQFLESRADIAIYGGAAGGGKSWALQLEPLKHVDNPRFGAVIFRRELVRIRKQGGLWDTSTELYAALGAKSHLSPVMEHVFPSGAQVQFGHLEAEGSKHAWAGSQIALLLFDQLEEFTEGQWWFMSSRNRSLSGVRPYVRATCNPVTRHDLTGGWLRRLIGWWIDDATGYPLEERAGKLRWFVRVGDALEWADRPGELQRRFGREVQPKSLTFIPARLDDNPTLTGADPGYRAQLEALPTVEREQLLRGNWNIRPAAGLIFDRAKLELVDVCPAECEAAVRYWDKAATPGGGDASAGVRMSKVGGTYYVEHVVTGHWSGAQRRQVQKQSAQTDGAAVSIRLEQEPGSSGKEVVEQEIAELAGFDVTADRVTGSKLTRSRGLASQVQAGNVKVVRGPWNEAYLDQLHNFTGADGAADDMVDASTGAFNALAAIGQWYSA